MLPTAQVDPLGGAEIRAEAATALRLADPRIRCIAVEACPALTHLDLTGCAPGLHLTVTGCPALRRLRLPGAGPGAVIHIDAGSAAPRLRIRGGLQSLDAAWSGGTLELAAPDDAPLHDAFIGLPSQEGTEWAHAAVVYLEATADRLEVPAGARTRVLQIHHAASLRTVSGGGAALQWVALHHCPGLAEVALAPGLRRLELLDCPELATVGGHGRTLHLGRSGEAPGTLRVTCAWDHLSVTYSGLSRLLAPRCGALLLRACPRLGQVEVPDQATIQLSGDCAPRGLQVARLRLDEHAVDALLGRAAAGRPGARTALLDWCRAVRDPAPLLLALEGLLGLARQGVDPGSLWTLRCVMHLRANRRARQRVTDPEALAYAAGRWSWRFPEDLQQSGWDRDLRLWYHCRHTPEAAPFRATVLRHAELPGLGALARALIRPWADGAGTRELEGLLRAALKVFARRGAPRPSVARRAGTAGREAGEYEQLLQAAVRLRAGEMADDLVACTRRLPTGRQIDLLATLAAYGHLEARTRLMRLAAELAAPGRALPGHRLPGSRSELQQRARALALAPIRSDALAGHHPTTDHRENPCHA